MALGWFIVFSKFFDLEKPPIIKAPYWKVEWAFELGVPGDIFAKTFLRFVLFFSLFLLEPVSEPLSLSCSGKNQKNVYDASYQFTNLN